MVALRVSLALGLGLVLLQRASAGYTHAQRGLTKRYASPPVSSTWDLALGYDFTASGAASNVYFYSVDLFDTAQSDIDAAESAGHYIACYFSAGSWEDWRPDASQFTAAMKGNTLDGYPHEKWVDTRNSGLRTIMANRIALAQQKGCTAIDPDNTDGYENDSGFPLTQNDAINYVQWLCSQAHAKGMGCGLKNNGDIVPDVVSDAEFVINEQCVQYDECDLYEPFITAGKPVFHVEYTDQQPADPSWKANACNSDGYHQFSTIIKDEDLDKYRETC